MAGFLRTAELCDPNAARPKGRPKQAVVEAVMKDRRLNAAEKSGAFMGGDPSKWFYRTKATSMMEPKTAKPQKPQ